MTDEEYEEGDELIEWLYPKEPKVTPELRVKGHYAIQTIQKFIKQWHENFKKKKEAEAAKGGPK